MHPLLKQKDAETALQSLLKEANPVSQMYALAGLKAIHPEVFEKAVTPFLTVKTKVKTARGCIFSEESIAEVVKDIRAGNYPLRPDKK